MADPDPGLAHDVTVIVDNPEWLRPGLLPDLLQGLPSGLTWDSCIRSSVPLICRLTGWPHAVEVNFLLTDDAALQRLNKEYRNMDRPTNVLSFPSLEPQRLASLFPAEKESATIILGDVALAFETIEREALTQNKPVYHHAFHLAVHGMLHLLGFDHDKEQEALKMEVLETQVLSHLFIPDPYHER